MLTINNTSDCLTWNFTNGSFFDSVRSGMKNSTYANAAIVVFFDFDPEDVTITVFTFFVGM